MTVEGFGDDDHALSFVTCVRHCEERRDEATQASGRTGLGYFAALAMTVEGLATTTTRHRSSPASVIARSLATTITRHRSSPASVIARSVATKQPRLRAGLDWVASLRSQ